MKNKWYSKIYDSKGMAERYMERTLKKYPHAVCVLQQIQKPNKRWLSFRVFVQLTPNNPLMKTELNENWDKGKVKKYLEKRKKGKYSTKLDQELMFEY